MHISKEAYAQRTRKSSLSFSTCEISLYWMAVGSASPPAPARGVIVSKEACTSAKRGLY